MRQKKLVDALVSMRVIRKEERIAMPASQSSTEAASTGPIPAAESAPDRRTLVAFASFVLITGTAAIVVRSTFSELAPNWSGALRFGSAALIFWALVLVRRAPLPKGRSLAGALIFGALGTGIGFVLVYWGLVKTQASLFQLTVAIVPLLTILFAGLHGLEQIRRRNLGGALLALVGIAIALSGSLAAGVFISLPHVLAIAAGAACFAEAGIVAKMVPKVHPFAMNALGMTVGSTILLTASFVTGEAHNLPAGRDIWLALAYLVVVSTVVNFLLYLFILGRWTASGASYSFVLTPIVTVILAVLFAGETISPIFLAGGALVLLGVWIGALRPHLEPVEEPVEDLQARPGNPTCI
jgi:drug/metabolite transporter (DMT)-like permease